MKIEIELTELPIVKTLSPQTGAPGAVVEFHGVVRDEENGRPISALVYEAYPEMAVHQIRRLLESISTRHVCLEAHVIHRLGSVPVGEAAIYVGITSRHRAEAIALLSEFMDRLKQDVPVWKRRSLPPPAATAPPKRTTTSSTPSSRSRTKRSNPRNVLRGLSF